MLEGLFVVFDLGDLHDEYDRTFLIAIRPRFADVFVRHRIVVLELRVGTALDDLAAHLRLRVGIAEIHDGNRDARITLRVLALEQGCFGANQDQIAVAGDPDRSVVRRAIGHQRGQMREVGAVDL